MEIPGRLLTAVNAPAIYWAVAENVSKSFLWLKPSIVFSGDDDRNRLSVPRDRLCALLKHSIYEFAKLVFGVLQGPRCHSTEDTPEN